MYSHTLCPVSLPFPALLPQGVPCKGLCQMRVFTVVKGTTSSPHGPRSWTKPCQMMYYSPAPTLLSQSHCRYGDHPILWEWNHYMVSVFPIFRLSEESFVNHLGGKCLLQQLVVPSWFCSYEESPVTWLKYNFFFPSLQWVQNVIIGCAFALWREHRNLPHWLQVSAISSKSHLDQLDQWTNNVCLVIHQRELQVSVPLVWDYGNKMRLGKYWYKSG